MANVKYRYIGIFDGLRLVSAHWAEQKEEEKKRNAPRKVQLNFSHSILIGQGRRERQISATTAEELGLFWKTKLTLEEWQELKRQGVSVGGYADIRAAIDNYGSNEQGGIWFKLRELLKVNGQPRTWSPVSSARDDLDELEDELNSELQEVA